VTSATLLGLSAPNAASASRAPADIATTSEQPPGRDGESPPEAGGSRCAATATPIAIARIDVAVTDAPIRLDVPMESIPDDEEHSFEDTTLHDGTEAQPRVAAAELEASSPTPSPITADAPAAPGQPTTTESSSDAEGHAARRTQAKAKDELEADADAAPSKRPEAHADVDTSPVSFEEPPATASDVKRDDLWADIEPLLRRTDWASIEHRLAEATDLPPRLALMLALAQKELDKSDNADERAIAAMAALLGVRPASAGAIVTAKRLLRKPRAHTAREELTGVSSLMVLGIAIASGVVGYLASDALALLRLL